MPFRAAFGIVAAVWMTAALWAQQQPLTVAPTSAATMDDAAQNALIDTYCATCHSKANKSGDLVKQYGDSPELMVIDTRPERPQMMYPFNGIQREIYDYCDEIRTRGSILELVERKFGASDQHEPSLDQFLGQMLDWQLMVREGNQFLSVAVPPVPFQPANPA